MCIRDSSKEAPQARFRMAELYEARKEPADAFDQYQKLIDRHPDSPLYKQALSLIHILNSNPATIMTDPGMADHTYIEPLTVGQVQGRLAAEVGQQSIRAFLFNHGRDAVHGQGLNRCV